MHHQMHVLDASAPTPTTHCLPTPITHCILTPATQCLPTPITHCLVTPTTHCDPTPTTHCLPTPTTHCLPTLTDHPSLPLLPAVLNTTVHKALPLISPHNAASHHCPLSPTTLPPLLFRCPLFSIAHLSRRRRRSPANLRRRRRRQAMRSPLLRCRLETIDVPSFAISRMRNPHHYPPGCCCC